MTKKKKKKAKLKKVLFTATVDSHIIHFHLPYLKLFKDNGYEVHVATNTQDKIEYADKKHKISFERSPIKINNLKAIKRLKKVIEKENFDIIHCHTPMGGVVTRLAAKKAGKKGTRVIYTAHGFHFYKGAPILNWLVFYPVEKYLAKYTDTLITINKEDYELAKKKFSKRCKDIQYVPGVGIDENKFNFEMTEEQKDELRKEVGVLKDDFVMICVGELNDNKNQIMQIQAVKELIQKDKYKNMKLLLAGEGENRNFLEQKIKEYNLQENVKLLGYRSDVPKLLKISNLLLSTSKREGLPVNVIEAMMCGLPVIGIDCRGNRDLIARDMIVDKDNNLEQLIKNFVQGDINECSQNDINAYMLTNVVDVMNNIYNRKKRVLHVLASNKYSGAENVACTIIQNLKDEYDMAYCCPKGPIEKQLNDRNIKYIPLNKLSIRELKKACNTFNPDIIHAHDYKASCAVAIFGKKHEVISHVHGNKEYMRKRNIKSLLFNILSSNLKKIIWVSDSCLDNFYYYNKVISKSIVLYNIVDQKEIERKSKLYECKEKYDLIFLGRLSTEKNPERLIEICNLLKEKKSDFKIAVVGDGDKREIVEKMVQKYDLSNNVKIYGFVDNPYPILKNSKILIMTSFWEGTPMVALEAQALSKPIISTPVDGLKEIVINNENGYLSDDNIVIVEKIIHYIKKNNLEKINEKIEKIFNYNNKLKKYIDSIKEVYSA